LDQYPELSLFRTSDRSLEVHRPDFEGSSAFDPSRHNTGDDAGSFRTAFGLPWAVEIVTNSNYRHPLEWVDMVVAFPQFSSWAASGGTANETWYDFPQEDKVYSFPGN
jgi:hypothetical protein